ncbi:MAG: hypothetical protein U0Y82_09915 [Thermoleophilia bacterium]
MTGTAELLSHELRRGLIAVALDFGEDLGVRCAVAVLDSNGSLIAAERDPGLPEEALGAAVGHARRALVAREPSGSAAAAGLPLGEEAAPHRTVGAVGVCGGPEGFSVEAAAVAARAVGLGRFVRRRAAPAA